MCALRKLVGWIKLSVLRYLKCIDRLVSEPILDCFWNFRAHSDQALLLALTAMIKTLHGLALAQPLIELLGDVAITDHVAVLSGPHDVSTSIFPYLQLSSCTFTCELNRSLVLIWHDLLVLIEINEALVAFDSKFS